jgi:hypothetical protein
MRDEVKKDRCGFYSSLIPHPSSLLFWGNDGEKGN